MPSSLAWMVKGIQWKRHKCRIIGLICLTLFSYYFYCSLLAYSGGVIFAVENFVERRIYPEACFDPWMDGEEEMPEGNGQFWSLNQSGHRKYFISNHPDVSFCSGLGNQMFRFASLYGLGRQLGRLPAFSTRTRCAKAELFPGELEWIFPVHAQLTRYIDFKALPHNQTHFAKHFASRDCCHFDDPQRANLSIISAEHLLLGAIYLQNFRYFDAYRMEIRKIFRFSPALCAWTMNEQKRIFGNDFRSHKLCVHTRRGDFLNRNWQSTKELTQKSIEFSIRKLRQKSPKGKGEGHEISIVLLGDDKQFLGNLSISKNLVHQIYVPSQHGRAEDMAFAVLSCDSLLITASASTFAWWIGYLMSGNGHIFFNANFTGMDRDRHNFLPNWIPIRMDLKNGQIKQFN